MSVTRINSHPFVTKDDRLLLQFEHYEANAKLYIRALEAETQVEIRSGVDQSTAQGKSAADSTTAVLVYDQVAVEDLPATAATDRVSEVRVVKGKADVDIVSPSPVHSFLQQRSTTIT